MYRKNGILVVKNFLSLVEVDSLRAACSQLVQVGILEKYNILKVDCKMKFTEVQVSNKKYGLILTVTCLFGKQKVVLKKFKIL